MSDTASGKSRSLTLAFLIIDELLDFNRAPRCHLSCSELELQVLIRLRYRVRIGGTAVPCFRVNCELD